VITHADVDEAIDQERWRDRRVASGRVERLSAKPSGEVLHVEVVLLDAAGAEVKRMDLRP
jgi:hypothetical protein